MTDRTGDPEKPERRGPWPQATSLEQLFDHGAPWCENADGHPPPDGHYPDAQRHVPPFECRTAAFAVPGAQALDGPEHHLEVYAARAYRFGEPRATARPAQTRIVFDCVDEVTETETRVSISPGDALRLCRRLTAIVDQIDAQPPHGTP